MIRVRLFTGFCELYCRSLQQHPLTTKALTTAAVAGASDIACQSIEQHPALLLWSQEFLQQLSWPYNAVDEQHRGLLTTALPSSSNASVVMANSSSSTIHYNWNRTLQVCIVGLCWAGPAQHTWYNILERVVRIQHRVGGLVTRVALDAMVYTPFGRKCVSLLVRRVCLSLSVLHCVSHTKIPCIRMVSLLAVLIEHLQWQDTLPVAVCWKVEMWKA